VSFDAFPFWVFLLAVWGGCLLVRHNAARKALLIAEPALAKGDLLRRREAVLGFAVNPVSTAEVMAVADARETMPQKSTYFYPKVPTGLVLNPL